ncbi:MAG: carboxypeptidase regulatory-like domain-containing protein [Candidatus Acidiferrum sp.]
MAQSVRYFKYEFTFLLILSLLFFSATSTSAQSTYTAQLTGVVTDASGGVIPGVRVILTDEGTGVPSSTVTDSRGIYVFTGVRPSTYTIRVEAPNMATQEHKGVTLAVSQQATINFTLNPGSVSEKVEVTEQAPLLDTGDASLGTDVTNEYVRDIPLVNRSMFGLVFLAGGVTETTGSGTQDSYPSGTNFVSNGQRNATAEVRLDGALTSAPEQGEGGNTNVYYQPSVEIVQEFKVENNSFSAEYGNNGGTVVNMVLKQGTNDFHGSGWWFGQRAALDANDWFNNADGIPRPDHVRDQYGASLGGPIQKQKTFFFMDVEFTREHDPVNINGTVPTDAERNGDFSQTLTADANGNPTLQTIYNPFDCVPQTTGSCVRPQFQGNVIPQQDINPIGQALLKLYPQPNVPADQFGLNNFRTSVLTDSPSHQFDVKVDHYFTDKQRVGIRYSQSYGEYNVPFVLGSGTFNDGFTSSTTVHNIGLEHSWNLSPNTVWTNRLALDRVSAPNQSTFPSLTSVGFPASLEANGLDRIPTIQLDSTNNWLSMFTQCCTDTRFAHTLWSYSSSLSWVKGPHTLKFGFEQRIFFNNFFQPNYPTGFFDFPQNITASNPASSDTTQGNSFASLLLGYGAGGGSSYLGILPSVADKSMETAFYTQDNWKVNSKLTINLGLRYEWSSPYTERFNRQQFSDFSGNTGVSVFLPNVSNAQLSAPPPMQTTATELIGTTLFVNQGGLGRSVPTDRNNVAPRIGFAWSFDSRTVVRGGAGIYYGLSPATNFQYPGTAFSTTDPVLFTTNNYLTQFATLQNPFPLGISAPQGQKYGKLAMWGYDDSNNLGTEEARNADIYQWNLGIQHLFPSQITIGIDYSANRSNHLPWGGYNSTRNRNFIPSNLLAQISSQLHAQDPNCDEDSCVSNYLNQPVNNPFYSLFNGPTAIFNEPASAYTLPTVPLLNLLRPYPQFNGTFQGLPNFGANSWYNSMQIRFQKRATHYISFEGNYTVSKSEDDSSIGFNAFVGNLNTIGNYTVGNPQQLDRLKNEWSISANDAPQRLVLATIVDLPLGRGRWIGSDMNRYVDGVVGGWSISFILTEQSGQPLPIAMAVPRLADGNQRPDVICNQVASGLSYHTAAANYLNGNANSSLFNAACFADPGDQVPGNAPRYFSNLRGDGIHNIDLSFTKAFTIKESKTLQLRGEFFNFTNSERFAFPDLGVGSATFGDVTSSAPGFTPRIFQFGMRFQF